MKKLVALFVLGITGLLHAQDPIGYIPLEDGGVFYHNAEPYFTVQLDGEVNFDNWPLIQLNGENFQLITVPFSEIDPNPAAVLEGYRAWEMDFINSHLPAPTQAVVVHAYTPQEPYLIWYYDLPELEGHGEITQRVDRTYFFNSIKGQFILGYAYSHFVNTPDIYQSFLLNLYRKTTHYNNPIDLPHLAELIEQGVFFYQE